MSLITVGTMAFDAIETPFGKVDKIVGGSATYVAWWLCHLCSLCCQQFCNTGSASINSWIRFSRG